MYKPLSKIYYSDPNNYENTYNRRLNNECSIHLHFPALSEHVFFLTTPELLDDLYQIMDINSKVNEIFNSLPKIAINQFRNKCLIDEIIQTNEIEGVQSSRSDIKDVLDNDLDKSRRFHGIVNKYLKLNDNDLEINNVESIRKLFDELVSEEIKRQNPKNLLDGELFRSGNVSIYKATQKKIHDGLYPESKIINSMNDALAILNDENLIPIIRIIIFHYLFGYIHPFYDGNGRVGRFISSLYFSKELNPLIAYRLSYTIKQNINLYYSAFDVVNKKINRGDITYFLTVLMLILKKAMLNLHSALSERREKLDYFSKYLDSEKKFNKNEKRLIYLLIQAELFADNGISLKEIEENLRVSRVSVLKWIKEIETYGLLKKHKEGRTFYFGIVLDNLEIK